MNIKEIGEIKRRFKTERSNMGRIRGALINEKKEIISFFDQSLNLISEEEHESILSVLKKTLSGSLNKNLTDIVFTNQQVLEGDEHKTLNDLRKSGLSDDTAFNKTVEAIRGSYNSEGNYVVIFGCDYYDVPTYGKDGSKNEDTNEIYTYIVCAICPVTMSKTTLGYRLSENVIKNNTPDWVISSPDAGFIFPAFDGRRTNIYNALFYNKNIKDNCAELINTLFRREAPMPVFEQKQIFTNIIRDTLAEDCSIEVVKNVQEQFSTMIEEHKALKAPEPLTVSKSTVSEVLSDCGIDKTKVEEFENRFDSSFGEKAEVSPENILTVRSFEVKTPEVSIKLSSDSSDLVQTRIIDGEKFIMIRADGIVEVNGVEINIQ